MQSPYDKIPRELRLLDQWALSGENKAPLSTNGITTFNISVTERRSLLSFESAVYYAKLFGLDFGFVLFADDAFTCIDLDVTDKESQLRKGQLVDESKWTTQDQFNRYWSIIKELKSYTELSKYGRGLHIWVRGNIGAGMRREGVEVYSQERYIICTGKSLFDYSIQDGQNILDKMQLQMRPRIVKTGLEEYPEVLPDDKILEMAMNASNSDKFTALCNGDWSGYPSQSEADLALMSMFTFYSESNEQCRRLFRLSGLGQRDKAIKDDRYLNNTLKTIRSREQESDIVNTSQLQIAAQFAIELQQQRRQTEFLHTPYNTTEDIRPLPPESVFAQLVHPLDPTDDGDTIEYPPGIIGTVAKHIYDTSPRPVKEVAIVSALGFFAGICGRGWSITQSGLNMYIILVGRSGIGKEAMHSGISALIQEVGSRCPEIGNFITFNKFASGQALIKFVAENNSVVNVAGEWGRILARLAKDDGRDSSMDSLRTAMTDLYQKSGPNSIVGGITYSDKSNNISSTNGVAYSMIGETTPGTFYEALTDSMMADGFLSRFTIVEYDGDRKPLNSNMLRKPDSAMLDSIATLVSQASSNMKLDPIQLQRTEGAAKIIKEFEIECDMEINSTTDEAWRQMWNRASLKVLKLAGLCCAADNFLYPTIQEHHLEWALKLVRKDIALMTNKIKSGDIGLNDNSRENKLMTLIEEYLMRPVAHSYKVDPLMRAQGVITKRYLQQRCSAVSSFTKYPQGSTRAVELCIKSLMDSGYLCEVPQSSMLTAYNFSGKGYRILNTK